MALGRSFDSLVKALKGGAFLNVGTTANTVASGNDSRIVNALDKNKNLSDVQDKLTSCRNIQAFPLRGSLGNTNLNTIGHIGAEGLWYQERGGHGAIGYPLNNIAGSLMIQRAGDVSTTHTFVEWNSGRTWTRTYTGQAWTPWSETLLNTRNLADVSDKETSLKNIGGFPFKGALADKAPNNLKGNDYGIWYQPFSANATVSRGYPEGVGAGTLEIYQNFADGANGCVQIYRDYNNKEKIFSRVYQARNSSWSAWTQLLTSEDNLASVKDKEQARRNLEIYRAIYPVGIVVMFDSGTNPNTTFYGTTWAEIKDGRAVRSSPNGTTNTLGSDSFTLTEANIPKHTHTISGTISANGNHNHWGGWNGPGNSVWDEKLPNEDGWTAAVRLTGRGLDTSGTNNQGQHDRRRTTTAGSHSHTFSGSVSTAYNSPTTAVTHYGASKYYRMWKRVS